MAKSPIAPVHPGTYVKELLEELELSRERLAQEIRDLGRTHQPSRQCKAPGDCGAGIASGTLFRTEPPLLVEPPESMPIRLCSLLSACISREYLRHLAAAPLP